MEKEFANYDLFDRVIANERKARSWTVFWITLLCIMAGTLIWALVSISEKNRTIKEQLAIVEKQKDSISIQKDTILNKQALIDFLKKTCDGRLANYSDSLKKEVDSTISTIAKIETTTNPVQQREKAIAITRLNLKFQQIKTDFQKDKLKLYIHYNYANDKEAIDKLVNTLNSKNDYLVLPPELIRVKFSYLIKCFNYEDPKKEDWLKKTMAGGFNVDAGNISISHETKKGMSPTIELWIGSPKFLQFDRVKLVMPEKKS